jgi:Pyridine nucleotide-disulphide oxidoreductase, dimerisation domain
MAVKARCAHRPWDVLPSPCWRRSGHSEQKTGNRSASFCCQSVYQQRGRNARGWRFEPGYHSEETEATGRLLCTSYQLRAYLPHKQGRVAGETAIGRSAPFAGTLGTQVVKVFDLVIARTGLRENETGEAGFEPLTVEGAYWDHTAYYPGAHRIQMRLVGDRATGRLLGAQMAGPIQAEVAKRVDILATALYHEITVEALSDLDLSYTPPLGSPWDLVQMCAQDWRALARRGQAHTSS